MCGSNLFETDVMYAIYVHNRAVGRSKNPEGTVVMRWA